VNNLEVFRGKERFIIDHRLKGFKETGGILDPWMGVLAYFKHEHTWKSTLKAAPGPSWINPPPSSRWKTRTIDIVFETFHGALLGEMHEIPPELMTIQSRKKWEIYNAENELQGVVREKPKAFGSDWVLENSNGELIASIKGNVDTKEYEIHNNREEAIARCYWNEAISEECYIVDILDSEFDLFLVLSYIIILDFADSIIITKRETRLSKWLDGLPLNENMRLALVIPILVAGILSIVWGYPFGLTFWFLSSGIILLIFFVLRQRLEEWWYALEDPV
jgi:uncharacterized protein YxjI